MSYCIRSLFFEASHIQVPYHGQGSNRPRRQNHAHRRGQEGPADPGMDEIPPDQPRPVFSIRPEHEPFFLPGNCSLLSVSPSPDLAASSSLQDSVVTHTASSTSVSA